MKDFGNDSYSGDCFFLVGQLKGLDCNRAADFVEILEIIDRDLGLGWLPAPGFRSPATVRRAVPDKPEETPEKPVKPYQFREQKFPLAELVYWQQYGITPELLERYKVCRSGNTTAKRQRANRTPTLHRWQNPCTATRANSTSSCTARSPRPASSTAAASAKTTVSGWNNCQPKATRYSSRAARKTCFRWRRTVFTLSASTAKRWLSRPRWFIGWRSASNTSSCSLTWTRRAGKVHASRKNYWKNLAWNACCSSSGNERGKGHIRLLQSRNTREDFLKLFIEF